MKINFNQDQLKTLLRIITYYIYIYIFNDNFIIRNLNKILRSYLEFQIIMYDFNIQIYIHTIFSFFRIIISILKNLETKYMCIRVPTY